MFLEATLNYVVKQEKKYSIFGTNAVPTADIEKIKFYVPGTNRNITAFCTLPTAYVFPFNSCLYLYEQCSAIGQQHSFKLGESSQIHSRFKLPGLQIHKIKLQLNSGCLTFQIVCLYKFLSSTVQVYIRIPLRCFSVA